MTTTPRPIADALLALDQTDYASSPALDEVVPLFRRLARAALASRQLTDEAVEDCVGDVLVRLVIVLRRDELPGAHDLSEAKLERLFLPWFGFFIENPSPDRAVRRELAVLVAASKGAPRRGTSELPDSLFDARGRFDPARVRQAVAAVLATIEGVTEIPPLMATVLMTLFRLRTTAAKATSVGSSSNAPRPRVGAPKARACAVVR